MAMKRVACKQKDFARCRVVRQLYSCASPCADGTGARSQEPGARGGCPSRRRGAVNYSEWMFITEWCCD